ncbi:flavodoxin [Bombilactobacillus thymidiniphilus]|uniref:Flavodoxin n=1 Tax=Bombilactobacillus thymidiniphilus TaxID=2923363 RepID=A0ABY4PCD2_9LACO|nr:flavodoxin [Bombilactobacillus thymidiniphilus]UQS83250.1 flavodoxin [Bombilactobacillus thymidiniphilus]
MTKVKIVFASMTGNDEDMADILSENFEEAGMEVDISEISQTDVQDYQDADICIMVSYTYSDGLEGNIPDEGLDFYHDLLDSDLTGKTFGVCGSGDTFYEEFGVAVDHFTTAFQQAGALQGAPSVKVELAPNSQDIANLDEFAQQIIAKFA